MAKVSYAKLDLKVNNNVKQNTYTNSKGEEIQYEVKHYLPVEEKMEMISRIINQSVDDNGYYNPMRIKIFTVLEITYTYTNFNFTAKQKENIFKLYDQLISTGIFSTIKNVIWEEDLKNIEETVISTIDNIYKYKNSAMGILDTISSDYNNLNLDATDIQSKLADPNNMEFLKSVLTKLG